MINDLWYKNAVIYCLSVGTYMDSNVDTIGDFVEFTHGAKQRGIRVLIDLVVNHTSDEHPWFKQARKDPDSKYRDWYVWSKRKPPRAHHGMVFPGVQKSTWSYDHEAKAWYFHRFYDFQPDLNTSHPEVQAELLKIMGFWIQLGVSGFRMGPSTHEPARVHRAARGCGGGVAGATEGAASRKDVPHRLPGLDLARGVRARGRGPAKGLAPTRVRGGKKYCHPLSVCRGRLRSPSRSRGQAGHVEGRCPPDPWYARGPRGQASHIDYSNCRDGCCRLGVLRARAEYRPARAGI